MSTPLAVSEIPAYSQLFQALEELKQPAVYRIIAAIIGDECELFVDVSDISPFFASRDFHTLEILLKDGFQQDLIRSLSSVILAIRSVAYDRNMTSMTEAFAQYISLAQMLINQWQLVHSFGSFGELCQCADTLFRNPQSAISVLSSQCLQWIQYPAKDAEREGAICFDLGVLEQVSVITSNTKVSSCLPSLEELNKQIDPHVDDSIRGVAHALLRASMRSKVLNCLVIFPF